MKRLAKLWTRVDDLAEWFLFDLVLGGRRRRVAAGLAMGLAGYLVSGFVLAPSGVLEVRPEVEYRSGRIEPFQALCFDDATRTLIEEAGEETAWTPGRRQEIADLLARRAPQLAAAVAVTGSGPVTLARTPDYREIRTLARTLVQRARLEASGGAPDAAVRDLVTSFRIGRSLTLGVGGQKPLLIEGMIAVAVFGATEKVASGLVAEGLLPAASLAPLVRELGTCQRQWPDLKKLGEGEMDYFAAFMDGWAATARLPSGFPSMQPLRLILPIAESARREFARDVLERMRSRQKEEVERCMQGLAPAAPESRFSLVDAVLAPFSRERAARTMVEVVWNLVGVNWSAAKRRMDQRSQAISQLRIACLEEMVAVASRQS